MSQHGGRLVPAELSELPSDRARRATEAQQQEAMVSTAGLGWVPRLYYWMKQKYGGSVAPLGAVPPTPRP
jgi:hypothetical protein